MRAVRTAKADPKALTAIRSARQRMWALAGDRSSLGPDGAVTMDIDTALVTAYSEKQDATPTWKRAFGHPLLAFIVHGAAGTGAGGRIRAARDAGLRNLPLHGAAHNQVWLEVAFLAPDPPAWLPVSAPRDLPAAGSPRPFA
ncbi:hypothetical protein ACIQWV_28600 [Streptomyces sp. NPDC098085]|uniref:hypothetical protein n=1 Tax=unclassified Streptomyces TaxID=2593676 RepID=UPI0033E08E5C